MNHNFHKSFIIKIPRTKNSGMSYADQGINQRIKMKLIRYKTSAPFIPAFSHSRLLDDLDRLFDSSLAAADRNRRFGAFPVDVYQDKTSVIVRAELPGFRKEDVQVQVANDTLTISAHVVADEDKGKDTTKTEKSIQRAIAMPENFNYEKVSATYENGVLTVTLPKREEVKPTTIAIEVK